MSSRHEVFRLPIQSPILWLVAAPFLVLAVLAWPHKLMVAGAIAEALIIVGIGYAASVVTVGEDGLVLCRIWKLPWSRVASARRTSFFGLPYILVARQRGFSWWLPLYFLGDRPIETAIAEWAPDGNPLKVVAHG
jgi:hypothetical protein